MRLKSYSILLSMLLISGCSESNLIEDSFYDSTIDEQMTSEFVQDNRYSVEEVEDFRTIYEVNSKKPDFLNEIKVYRNSREVMFDLDNIQTNFDITRTGDYSLKITILDDNNVILISKEYKLKVIDSTAPVVETISNSIPNVIDVGTPLSTFVSNNFTCVDNYSFCNITFDGETNTNLLGTISTEVVFSDSSNNETRRELILNVVDLTAPRIRFNTLSDNKEVRTEINVPFVMPSFEVTDNYDINPSTKIENNVDTSRLGEYTVIISSIDSSDNVSAVILKVIVVDTTKPSITPTPSNVEIEYGEEYVLPEFICTDNDDCELTVLNDIDLNELGEYQIEVIAVDPSNNITKYSYELSVVDTTSPTIRLKDENLVVIPYGLQWDSSKRGYEVFDNYYLTPEVNVVDDYVANDKYGQSQKIGYFATDISGNRTEVTQTIINAPFELVRRQALNSNYLFLISLGDNIAIYNSDRIEIKDTGNLNTLYACSFFYGFQASYVRDSNFYFIGYNSNTSSRTDFALGQCSINSNVQNSFDTGNEGGDITSLRIRNGFAIVTKVDFSIVYDLNGFQLYKSDSNHRIQVNSDIFDGYFQYSDGYIYLNNDVVNQMNFESRINRRIIKNDDRFFFSGYKSGDGTKYYVFDNGKVSEVDPFPSIEIIRIDESNLLGFDRGGTTTSIMEWINSINYDLISSVEVPFVFEDATVHNGYLYGLNGRLELVKIDFQGISYKN